MEEKLQVEAVEHGESNEHEELAVSVEVQQEAALYAIGTAILSLGNVPNKKSVKSTVKRLKRNVVAAIGKDGADELLSQNKGALDVTVLGVRKNPDLEDVQRKQYLRMLREEWTNAFFTGIKGRIGA